MNAAQQKMVARLSFDGVGLIIFLGVLAIFAHDMLEGGYAYPICGYLTGMIGRLSVELYVATRR